MDSFERKARAIFVIKLFVAVQVLYLVYATICCVVNKQWAQLGPVAFVCAMLIGLPLVLLYVMKKLPEEPS